MIYTMTLNPALDYVMHPNTLDMGFTNRSSSEELHCGGNGINVSTLLNELDKVTVAMGIVGGFTGEYLLSDLQRQGIPSNFVKLDSGFTRINVKLNGIVMTMVNGNGPRIPEKKVDELLERMDLFQAHFQRISILALWLSLQVAASSLLLMLLVSYLWRLSRLSHS